MPAFWPDTDAGSCRSLVLPLLLLTGIGLGLWLPLTTAGALLVAGLLGRARLRGGP